MMEGLGSSTVTVLTIELQPPQLHTSIVTWYSPGVEKVCIGFCSLDTDCASTSPADATSRAPPRAALTLDIDSSRLKLIGIYLFSGGESSGGPAQYNPRA